MILCKYRENKECRLPETRTLNSYCQLCLIGQLCDETSLNTRAFMDASINRLEKEANAIDKA